MRGMVGLLGELEWTVMRSSWKLGKTTARNIFEDIKVNRKVQYQTIKTTLDRLATKGFIEREKLGPIWLYAPKANEKMLKSKALENFAQTVFGTTIAPIFINLLKKKKYSHELDEMKRLVNELDEEE